MMIIVLIRRCVRRDKEQEFLASYRAQKPTENPDFLGEDLTRLDQAEDLPESMRSFSVGCGTDCVTYINVTRWRTAEAFRKHFKPETAHDPAFETADRVRAVLNVINVAEREFGTHAT